MRLNRTKPYRLALLPLLALAYFAVHSEAQNRLPKKQHRTSDAPFLKPAEAVAQMSIPKGFDVTVCVSEPEIAEPIAFTFDDRGRIWIVENMNYRTRKNHTDDPVTRIVIFEDTDRDGRYDKKTTFADNLTFTSGIALGFGGVFVGSPPNFSFIPDKDGDDKPDGPPQVLLDGWGINDRHETLNSFIWGPDGWLYGCHGVFTMSHVGKPGDSREGRQAIDGGIWRYHPVTGEYEVFARGLSNPWGFDFDDTGQGFATCCVIPHLFHVVQGGVYHKQSRPHLNPHIYDDIKTIRDHSHLSAHGGARFYLADAFPKKYHGNLFMCNIHEHCVLTDIMHPKGSSFIGSHGEDFLPTNDLAWVGFSVEIGPDGGVYLLDWHDTDVCGNTINFPDSGRVYRVLPKAAKPTASPNLRTLSDLELVEMQLHANDWYVRQSRVLLHGRAAANKLNAAPVHARLNQILDSADTIGKRLRALWALHVTAGLDQTKLTTLLNDSDPYMRSWAIQLLVEKTDVDAFYLANDEQSQAPISAAVMQQFVQLAKNDPSPIVRLYLASAVQRFPFKDRWPVLTELVKHADDIQDNNLARMYWFALEPMVTKSPKESLRLAIEGSVPRLQEFVARRMVIGDSQPGVSPDWQSRIQKVAPGFQVSNVGEGGVVEHKVFRNKMAVQTHPLDKGTACTLFRKLKLPPNKKTRLKMRVSHHPHGDWELRILVDKKLVTKHLVASKTVSDTEWLDVEVDLSRYAGKLIRLDIQNKANNWMNEWAYWNYIQIVHE